MQSLFIIRTDFRPFDRSAIEHVFRSTRGFQELQFDTPWDLMECEFVEANGRTRINLDKDQETICLSHSGDAALRAVLIIQKSLGIPLRVFDNTYSFDLTFSNIESIEELEAAMDNAKTS